MFMLWAIPVGIVVGLLVGGRIGNLSGFRFRWVWLAVAGLLVQVVLIGLHGHLLRKLRGNEMTHDMQELKIGE